MRTATQPIATESVSIQELFSLHGRVALVTGGGGRYGRQITTALAEAGATVIVASRNLERCEEFAAALKQEGFSAHALQFDLGARGSAEELAAQIDARWGRLDVLFNNAVAVRGQPLAEHSAEDWAQMMEYNSTGLYSMCRVFGEKMAERGRGSIVNVASIYAQSSPDFRIYDGHAEMTNPPSYGFAKAGMLQLTRYLAVYFGPRGVRVNSLSPGGLRSPEMPEEFVGRYSHRTALGRMAGPNDLKGAAVFLASDAAAYVTGHNLLVDGGYSAL